MIQKEQKKWKTNNTFNFMKRLILAPLLLTLIAGCSSKDKTYIERRDDCADTIGGIRSTQSMIEKYKLGREFIKNRNLKKLSEDEENSVLTNFCSFYLMGEYPEI